MVCNCEKVNKFNINIRYVYFLNVVGPGIGQTAKFLGFVDSPGFVEAKLVHNGGILTPKIGGACKEVDVKLANRPCLLRPDPKPACLARGCPSLAHGSGHACMCKARDVSGPQPGAWPV
jgi:hypothetical protein